MSNHPSFEGGRGGDDDDELRHRHHRQRLPATIPSEGYPPPPLAGMGRNPLPPPPAAPAREHPMRRGRPAVEVGEAEAEAPAAPPPPAPIPIPTPATPPGSFARMWLRGGCGGGSGSVRSDESSRVGGRDGDGLARSLRCAYSQFAIQANGEPSTPPSQILSEALALSSDVDPSTSGPPPLCFLTVLPDDPRIAVVHGLATYAESFGARNPYQGRVLAFLGDRPPDCNPDDADSMPPLLVAPVDAPDDSAESLFGSEGRRVPRRGVLTRFFDADDGGRGRGRGDETTLHPTPGGDEVDRAADYGRHLPKLAFVPPSWAAHFLGGPRPYDALRTGERLAAAAAGLSSGGGDRRPGTAAPVADPLLDWLRAACCRRSGDARDVYRSAMSVEWTPVLLPPPATDAEGGGGGVRGWALRRMRMLLGSPFDGGAPARGPSPAPVGREGGGDGAGMRGGELPRPPPVVVVAPSPPNLVTASEEGGATTAAAEKGLDVGGHVDDDWSRHRDEQRATSSTEVDLWEELGIARSRTGGRRCRDGAEGVLSTIVVPASVEEAVKDKFCYNQRELQFSKRLCDETGCTVALRGKGVTSRAFPYRHGEDGGDRDRVEILAEGTTDGVAEAERRVLELLRDLLRRSPPPSASSGNGNGPPTRGRRRGPADARRDRAAGGGGGGGDDDDGLPLNRPLTVPRKRKYDHHGDDADDDRGDNCDGPRPGGVQRSHSNGRKSHETRQAQGNRKNHGNGLHREGVDLQEFVPSPGFHVDETFMSRLIGKGGCVIKKLMRRTNCKLSLNFTEKKMYISGIDQQQIDEAVDIIRAYCRSI